jgi:hypothetical protein
MKIRKFNEATSIGETKVWLAIYDDGENQNYRVFSSKMLACDFIIKITNDTSGKEFEPFFDDNGDRFFSSIEENLDYQTCLDFNDDHFVKVDVIETVFRTKPGK